MNEAEAIGEFFEFEVVVRGDACLRRDAYSCFCGKDEFEFEGKRFVERFLGVSGIFEGLDEEGVA